MMVFADTAFYLALSNPQDQWHSIAHEWSGKSELRTVTSEFVLLEVGNGLAGGSGRRHFEVLLRDVRTNPRTRLVRASQGLFNDAAELYQQRPDKQWSLVDCSSFILMRRFKLKEALTTDHHFEQAGFRALLR
jgi:uncharacterized protein